MLCCHVCSAASGQGHMHSRTVKAPDFSRGQAIKSSANLAGNLILVIASASAGLKIPAILS
jgi:hypothetical protein